jgi:hypothetical protein
MDIEKFAIVSNGIHVYGYMVMWRGIRMVKITGLYGM